MARVFWSQTPLDQLREIYRYIELDNPAAAADIGHRLLRLGNSLGYAPRRGRPARNGTRELVTVKPYILNYEVDATGEVVTILSISHSARRPLD